MRLSARTYIFYLALAIACGYANAGAIAKRQASGLSLSGIVYAIVDIVRGIPLIGGFIAGILDWIIDAISLFEIGTNGAIGRLLGGAFPCEVALTGTTCKGLDSNGGFGKSIMDVIDGIPGLLLPGFLKSLIQLCIQLFIDPTVDVLFGGVKVNG